MDESELFCRVCFKTNEFLVYIFDVVEEHQTNLISLLETYGGLKGDDNLSLPHYLCDECTNELLVTTRFRKKCNEANSKLMQLKTDAASAQIIPYNCPEEHKNELIKESSVDSFDTIDVMIDIAPEKENQQEGEQLIVQTNEVSNNEVITLPQQSDEISNSYEISLAHVNSDPLNKEQPSLVCDICGACFMKAITLKRHMENYHQQVDFFTCSHCKHIFSKELNLKEHKCFVITSEDKLHFTKHIGNKQNRICVHCGKSFKNLFALDMHTRTHTGERPFACSFCAKTFKTKSALDNHINVHTGFLKYKCRECEKTFTDNSNLKRHMVSHTGEKPHVCSICKKSFARVFLLEYHLRTHTGERPYVCKVCQKGFTQLSSLRYHESTHTGESKYECSICQKSFPRRYLFKNHLEKLHPECPVLTEEEVTKGPSKLIELESDLNFVLSETGM